MKIGLVLDDTLDTPDGVQQYVLGVGKWLTGQEHEVHYLVGQTTRTDIPNVHSLSRNIHVKYNGNRLSVPLPASRRRLRGLLAKHSFDVLHVQVPYSPFMAGRLLKLTPQAAVVGTFHVLPYSLMARWANRLLALVNRRTARRFDHMVADSAPALEFATSTYHFKPTIIPNPLDLKQFAGVSSLVGGLQIVFLGRLVERKGAQHLLRAVVYIRENHLFDGAFKVIIGGRGGLLAQLQRFVADHQLQNIVEFTGFVAEADKAPFLAQADIAVFPSTSGESFGISLLEGMAASRGVVLGGDNPGYRSVLEPLDENRLVAPENTKAFAEQLAYWLSHPAERQAAADAQKNYVEQFDIGIVGQQLLTVYEQALQSRSHS